MSTHYAPMKAILMTDLFDGRLARFNIYEGIEPDEPGSSSRCLTDGRNYLWVNADERGFVRDLVRYQPWNDPGHILNAIAEVFGTDIASEYEARYGASPRRRSSMNGTTIWQRKTKTTSTPNL